MPHSVRDGELEELELYTTKPAARFAVEKLRRSKGVGAVADAQRA